MTDPARQIARRAPLRRPPREDVLDDLDREIIRLLQANARTPNTEIARALGVTETTIRNRVNRLLDEELIEVIAVITPRARQATMSAFLLLTIEHTYVDSVIESLVARRDMRWVCRVLSPAQVVVEAFFADQDALLAFQAEYLPTLPGLRDVQTLLTLKTEKASFEWEI